MKIPEFRCVQQVLKEMVRSDRGHCSCMSAATVYPSLHRLPISHQILQAAATSSIPQPSSTPTNGSTNVGSLKTCIARSARRSAPSRSSLLLLSPPLLSLASCSRIPADPWRPPLPAYQPALSPWRPRSAWHPFLSRGTVSPWWLRR